MSESPFSLWGLSLDWKYRSCNLVKARLWLPRLVAAGPGVLMRSLHKSQPQCRGQLLGRLQSDVAFPAQETKDDGVGHPGVLGQAVDRLAAVSDRCPQSIRYRLSFHGLFLEVGGCIIWYMNVSGRLLFQSSQHFFFKQHVKRRIGPVLPHQDQYRNRQ